MIAQKHISISILLVILLSGFTILSIKNKVRVLERQVLDTTTEIALEKENIAVLKSELTYLSRPERIRNLAEKHLELQQAQIKQVFLEKSDTSLAKKEQENIQMSHVPWRYKNCPNRYEVFPSKLVGEK
jgi:cell division protein FtsL